MFNIAKCICSTLCHIITQILPFITTLDIDSSFPTNLSPPFPPSKPSKLLSEYHTCIQEVCNYDASKKNKENVNIEMIKACKISCSQIESNIGLVVVMSQYLVYSGCISSERLLL